ncbi:MAG TPA: ABC transporter ATP-binding protein [Tepidiformaceae bacterium]|nr:ABC transporter ATP-binding protein [Tepidiformaceae bacterium]
MPEPTVQEPPNPAAPPTADVLNVRELTAGYARKSVVFDATLRVGAGEIVTMVGHNGAGKTTTLRAICGLNKPFSGTVEYNGRDVSNQTCSQKVKLGMSFIPAERFTFGQLSVQDNLLLGSLPTRSADLREQLRERVYEMFPVLRGRAGQMAATMRGGEQRMLSLGIAIMADPRLLLLDEPSLGLAPAIVQRIMDLVRSLATEHGLAVLLVEQNVAQALRVADRVYVMRSGRIILEESAEDMRKRPQLWDLF